MAIFKKEFYAEIDKIPRNRTITNVAINISEEAFKNMKDDPEYREKILSALKRDLTSSFAPLEASMVLTVGATAKDYRGDSWSGVNNQSEFFARSQNSFYKKTSNKKDRQKELLEEYLEKRAQVKKQQQEMLNEKIAIAFLFAYCMVDFDFIHLSDRYGLCRSGGRCDEGTRNGIWSDKRDFQILRGLGWCVDCCTGVSLFIYSIADNEFDEP